MTEVAGFVFWKSNFRPLLHIAPIDYRLRFSDDLWVGVRKG
jgi:hypothetical protein